MKKPSKERLLQLIEKSGGLVLPIAQACGCGRSSVYNWIHSDSDLEKAFSEVRENVLDMVESKYVNAAVAGDLRACEFLLKTLGRNRGFVESVDVTSGGKSFNGFNFLPYTAEADENKP